MNENTTARCDERLLNLARQLADISYPDWIKLKLLVSGMFETEKRKMERQLHLPMVSEQDLARI